MLKLATSLLAILALLGSSVSYADTLQVPMTRVSNRGSSQTFCSDAGDVTLAHPDGGVLTFSQICVVMSLDQGSIFSRGGASIKWMNHHLSVTPTLHLLVNGTTDVPLADVRMEGVGVGCGQSEVSFTGRDSNQDGAGILRSAGDSALLYLNWGNPDNSLCG